MKNPRVVKQAISLVRAGWRVHVISAGSSGEDEELEQHPGGFTILRTKVGLLAGIRSRAGNGVRGQHAGSTMLSEAGYKPTRFRLLALLISRILILLRMLPLVYRCRPQIILAHNVNTLITGWVASKFTGAKLIYDAHEINLNREGYYRQLKKLIWFIERALLPCTSLTMTTTAMRARHFRRVYKLETAPLVFENRPPFSRPVKTEKLRKAIESEAGRVIALYQGGLQEGRGLHNMVRAIVGVENVDLVFLGDGPQRHSLAFLAENLGVSKRVHFLSSVPLADLPKWTASADFGLQLLRNTCFNHYSTDSNKLFEYAVSGLPVVASDFPEIRRIVRAYDYGILVNPDDVSAIRSAIRQLAEDTLLREQLADNARKSGFDLSWDAVEKEYVAAIEGQLIINSRMENKARNIA